MVGGLDSSKKSSFLDIYKMDLADTMKQVLAGAGPGSSMKQQQQAAQLLHQQMSAAAAAASSMVGNSASNSLVSGGGSPSVGGAIQAASRGAAAGMQDATGSGGTGYVTEKLYMLLQLYLQNKGWNPSAELLQCFTELKDSAMLPSSDYLQVLANRMTLDSQGRLVLRESGKIVLPYEHFANAVMLKHMTGPHGLHLSVEATVRAVIDSYTIGRENFGMEKEFIVDVVQSCPNPACRYYKNHIGVAPPSFMDPATFQAAAVAQMSTDYMQHLPSQISATPIPKNSSNHNNTNSGTSTPLSLVTNDASMSIEKSTGQMDLSINKVRSSSDRHSSLSSSSGDKHSKRDLASQQQHQLTAAIIQQQNRAIAQQSLEKFGSLTALEKQRVLQQLDKKHYEAVAAAAAAAAAAGTSMSANQMHGMLERNAMVSPSMSSPHSMHIPPSAQQSTQSLNLHASSTALQGQSPNSEGPQSFYRSSPVSAAGSHHTIDSMTSGGTSSHSSGALDSNSSTNKDLLALHNGAWPQQPPSVASVSHHSQQQQHIASAHLHSPVTASAPIITMPSDSPHNQQLAAAGQEKIIRAFGELMRNMARMKTYIRPSMCKPYGKQSEGLQKTLGDTIQLVQSLRSCLPAPHIPVSSWKTEDRHGEY